MLRPVGTLVLGKMVGSYDCFFSYPSYAAGGANYRSCQVKPLIGSKSEGIHTVDSVTRDAQLQGDGELKPIEQNLGGPEEGRAGSSNSGQ